MPIFSYEAVDRTGKKVRSEIEASSSQEATHKIRQMGYFPLAVQEKVINPSGATGLSVPLPRVETKKRAFSFFTIGGVSQKQLTQFTHQLAVLQEAGLPLLRSLKILTNQLRPSPLKYIVEEVANDVETGSSLSEAMAKHPKAFDRLYVNMVKAGEAGGVLDTILTRLSIFLEKSQALKRRVIGALTYPAMVIIVAIIILTVIMTQVVPQFRKVFQELAGGQGLPFITELLLSLSNTIANWWLLIPGIPIGLYIIIKIIGRTPKGRLTIDRIKLSLPLVGIIIRKAAIARFCRTFGTLLASGVPILEALNIVRNAIGNEVIAEAVREVHDSIREGESIAAPLAKSGVFDDMVINMIEVGEETGELDKMLGKIADTYEAEVDVLVNSLTSILEPLIIVFLGVAVGFIVIALFMPLVGLMQTIGAR